MQQSDGTPAGRPVAARLLLGIEDGVAVAALVLLSLFPLLEIVLRSVLRTGILGQSDYLVHFVLLLGYIGGMITAREGRHLSMGSGFHGHGNILGDYLKRVTGLIAAAVCTALAWSALSFVLLGFGPGQRVGIVPIQLFVSALPVAMTVMAVRFARQVPRGRFTALGIAIGFAVGTFLAWEPIVNVAYTVTMMPPLWLESVLDRWLVIMPAIAVPAIIVLLISAFAGTPLFVVLAGTAFLLFARAGGALEVILNEGYTMLTGSTIPAIPLFTFTGYLLSESRAGERLVALFRALFGWIPGGLVIAAVFASVFFTSFTGASGVTILALGGLLFYVLHTDGNHPESFSVGILTSASNIGLLFPPSLAIIIYGTIAQVNIFHLFLGGILPGLAIVAVFSVIGVVVSSRSRTPVVPFQPRAALAAVREAIWEVLLPVVIVVVYFSGTASLVETAAVAVIYTVLVEVLFKREITLRALPSVALKCITIAGGVLIILASARALSFYIVDARIPIMLRDWVQAAIGSRIVFLILLNLTLLVTGCFMDIFSAIMIVAPLVVPLGGLFGIDPVHLGVIFLANLGLGFITPPVGIDLFLSSYRFDKPLPEIYRHVAPFFLVQLAMVLLITYVPLLATTLPRLFGG